MNQQFRCPCVGWLAAGLVVLGCGVAALAQLPPGFGTVPPVIYDPGNAKKGPDALPELKALKKAAVNGKYSELLTVIRVPADQANYGDFNDYGLWQGTEWAGYTGLPQGYWVYVHPHWYIWGKEGKNGAAANPANENVPAQASVNDKYSNLLKVIAVPGDQAAYGAFNDWGYWTGTSWAGHNNLPQGYWVYVAPKWYIWGKENKQAPQQQQQQQPQPAGAKVDPVKASVNGKYVKLLRVIEVPQDRAGYGEFNDWGHWAGTEWAGHQNLPAGYWVYVAPNWYIWGDVSVQPGNVANPQPQPNPNGLNEAKASINGKYVQIQRIINVPQDQAVYGAFNDWGYWTGTSWAGYDGLPAGYWVYVAPNWYIWGGVSKKPGGNLN